MNQIAAQQPSTQSQPKRAANDNANAWPTDGEVRMRMLKFVTPNLPISNVNAVNDKILARDTDSVNGIDLFYSPATRHYRIVRAERGAATLQLVMHESRVEFAQPW